MRKLEYTGDEVIRKQIFRLNEAEMRVESGPEHIQK